MEVQGDVMASPPRARPRIEFGFGSPADLHAVHPSTAVAQLSHTTRPPFLDLRAHLTECGYLPPRDKDSNRRYAKQLTQSFLTFKEDLTLETILPSCRAKETQTCLSLDRRL